MRLSIAPFAPALVALTFALTASAEVPKLDKTTVTFVATGPAGLKINGTGNKVTVSEDGGKVVFKSSIKNMKTGIGLRDKHLNKYLKAEGNEKTATFTVDAGKLKRDGSSATGAFSMNGKTKDVTVNYKVDGKEVKANFNVVITDFDIEQPCYLGVCCDTKVAVQVKLGLKD
jgi:hypothetical protein